MTKKEYGLHKFISVMLTALIMLSGFTFTVAAEETTEGTETTETVTTEITGITLQSGYGTLEPAFSKDVHQYTVHYPANLNLNQIGDKISFTVNESEGGDVSKVIETTPELNSSYSHILTVVNDTTNYLNNESYMITFVSGYDNDVLDVSCTEYTSINAAWADSTMKKTTDRAFWTGTCAANGSNQTWDLGEIKKISEIRVMLEYISDTTAKTNNASNWQVSVDGNTWVNLDTFTYAGSYSNNMDKAYSSGIFSSYRQVSMALSQITTATYARYIRHKVSTGNFKVREMFVIGSDAEPEVAISTDSGILAPAFSEDTTEYELNVRSLDNLPKVTATANDGFTCDVEEASAENGYTAKVNVSASGAVIKTYTIKVKEDAVRIPVKSYVSTAATNESTTHSSSLMFDNIYSETWTAAGVKDETATTHTHTFEFAGVYDMTELVLWCGNQATGTGYTMIGANALGYMDNTMTMSVDGTNWYTPAYAVVGMTYKANSIFPDGTTGIERTLTYTFEEGTAAKYIRFEIPKDNGFSIREFCPYGTERKEAINTLTVAADNEKITANVYAESVTENLNAFLAIYDETEKLIGIKMAANALTSAANGFQTVDFGLTEGAASCRIFYWNENLTPAAKAITKLVK